VRKLATAAAVSLALASGNAQALILGEIEMRSALNQPIDAEIGLSSVATGELEGMRVQLASQEAFSRAGIERTRVLTDLRFEVTENASGQPVIQISSRKPILEPFLNFLVDVEWRDGRLVREYTVLLDPPVFMSPSASLRNSSTDTPATVTVDTEDSILTPLPIDRGSLEDNSDEFNTAAVTTVGELVEVGDEQVSGVSNVDLDVGGVDIATEEFGEVIELGTLDEVGGNVTDEFSVATADTQFDTQFDESSVVVVPGSEFETDAVTLSDPSISNSIALNFGEEIEYDQDSGWEVQVMGDTSEVSDDVGTSLTSVDPVAVLGENVTAVEVDDFASADLDVGAPGEQVLVNKNDTLFEIAERNSIAGVSTQQMMIALLEANQQAFINGNINLVKEGAVLRIPAPSQANAITQTQALAEVSSQEQLWREYRDNLRGVQSNRTAVANADRDDANVASETLASNSSRSSAAQQILDQARQELRAQLDADVASNDELKIVADTQATSTIASATADESSNPDTEKLGSINKKLQLAREELAAARLESEELLAQSTELDSVTSNMDQLVTMQQDKLAKLQAQLKQAQENESLALAQTDTSGQAEALVSDAGNAMQDGASGVTEGVSATVGQIGDTVGSAASGLAAAADPSAEPVELTAIDDGQVAVVGAESASAELSSATIEPLQPATQEGPWYQKVMNKQGLAIGGLGLLAAGGLFALLRRRRDDVDDEALLDQVEFIDEEGAIVTAPDDAEAVRSDLAADMTGETVVLDNAMQKGQSDVAVSGDPNLDVEMDALGASTTDANVAHGNTNETLSNDDTISEAEVYLAYGLHGQAEDLLTKAIEQDPSNAEYREKLLHTYHAQGNQAAFEESAEKYYQDFGGANSPAWGSISALGQELNGSNDLFVSGDVESVGKGDFNAPKLDADDFIKDETGDSQATSQVREFGSADNEVGSDLEIDESDLLDQSLDPGFAFDENDLEASGDFSRVSEELKSDAAANEQWI